MHQPPIKKTMRTGGGVLRHRSEGDLEALCRMKLYRFADYRFTVRCCRAESAHLIPDLLRRFPYHTLAQTIQLFRCRACGSQPREIRLIHGEWSEKGHSVSLKCMLDRWREMEILSRY